MVSVAERERLALGIMLLVGKHFLDGKPPLTAAALANRLKTPAQLVKELLHVLAGTRLLQAVSDGQGYLPARDLERIGIKEILDSLRTFGEPQGLPVQGDQVAIVDHVVNEVDRAVATSLAGKDLKTLILEQEPRSPTSPLTGARGAGLENRS